MFDKLVPTGDRILVRKQAENDENVSGGVILTIEREQTYIIGDIVNTGPGKYNPHKDKTAPLSVKTGDTVLFGKYVGTHVDKDFVVLREEEVLGIVSK